jgi:hypothetical protein
MSGNGMMTLQGDPLSSNPFPKGGHLLGNHDTHQGEIGEKGIISKQIFSKSRKDPLQHVQMLQILK